MLFAKLRHLIYSALILVADGKKIYDVDIMDPAINIYDTYEVIGIRSTYYDHEEYVIISLKPTLSTNYAHKLEKGEIINA